MNETESGADSVDSIDPVGRCLTASTPSTASDCVDSTASTASTTSTTSTASALRPAPGADGCPSGKDALPRRLHLPSVLPAHHTIGVEQLSGNPGTRGT